MKFRVMTAMTAVIAGAGFAGPADAQRAAWPFACSAANIALPAAAVYEDCRGFYEGNLLSNSAADTAAITAAIAPLGVSGYSAWVEKIDLAGASTLDFSHMLYGETVIGVHFGAGAWVGPKPAGGATAFFRFDAGSTGLDIFGLNMPASSGAALFKTGLPPVVAGPVPEPGTYALLLAGLAAIGFVARRRRAD